MKRKKQVSNKTILTVFIVFIIVTSLLGIMFSGYTNQSNQQEYNSHKFKAVGNFWTTEINKHQVQVHYFPTEVNTLNFTEDITPFLKTTQMAYIAIPTEGLYLDFIGLAAYELAQSFAEYGIYPVQGLSDSNTGYELPIVTCANATSTVPVIIFEQSNQTAAFLDSNCIHIQGSGNDFVMLKDALVLRLWGII
ncbi:MAG: hypothetical protein ABIG95_04835 [Candidatus Woesearchaeota archaeon]